LNFLKFETATGAIATQVVLHVCVLLFLLAITGVPSYFFHPAHLPIERQNRAVALSYYTSAPLVLVPCAYVLIAVAAHFGEVLGWVVPATILAIAGGVCALAGPFAWAAYLRKLGNATMGGARAWKTTMLVIPLGLVITFLTLGALPLAIYYVAVVVHSVVN